MHSSTEHFQVELRAESPRTSSRSARSNARKPCPLRSHSVRSDIRIPGLLIPAEAGHHELSVARGLLALTVRLNYICRRRRTAHRAGVGGHGTDLGCGAMTMETSSWYLAAPPFLVKNSEVLAMRRIASVLVLSALCVSVTTCTKKPAPVASRNTEAQRTASPRAQEVRSNDADEAAVYAAVIEWESMELGQPVLVASEMDRSPNCGREELNVKSETSPWRSAVVDYLRRRAAGGIIGPTLPLSASAYELLTPAEMRRRPPPKNRNVLQFLALTAVGFDATRTRAVLHRRVGCVQAGLCGHGGDLFLEKQSGTWRFVRPQDVDRVCFWIS